MSLVYYNLYVIPVCHVITQFIKTPKKTIGGNTYNNEMVAYLHMTWLNHAKLIKAAAPKTALMKGTGLNRLLSGTE